MTSGSLQAVRLCYCLTARQAACSQASETDRAHFDSPSSHDACNPLLCFWHPQEDAVAQAHAREEYKLSMEANDQERQRKMDRKRREQQENADIMQQAIALRQRQDQVGVFSSCL